MCVWKSGHQLPARARVRSTIFPLFVRKKKDNQTTHGCIVAVSFILGPPGLQTYVFFPAKFWKLQSACAHVIPTWACLHNIFTFDFQFFVIFHAIYYHHKSSCFPVGRFLSLGWGFGTFLAFDCRCLQRGAEDEKNQ